MSKKELLLTIVFFTLGIISRFPLVEKMQSHWDGPQYSIAILRYSFEQQTPAIPGYPLYIGLGKLIFLFTHDPHRAMIILSVLFAGFGAAIFYLVGRYIFDKTTGIIASLLFLSGATFYFFGLTAYPYGLLPAISTLYAVLIFTIFYQKKHWGIVLGFSTACIIGFRPQEILFIPFLFLIAFNSLDNKQKIYSVVSLVIGIFLWLVPLFWIIGGVKAYVLLMAKNIPAIQITSEVTTRQAIEMLTKGMFLSFGMATIFLLYYLFSWKRLSKKQIVFFCAWILPVLMFNIIIRTDHAGHQMTYLSGLLLLIAYAVKESTKKSKFIQIGVVAIIVLFNLFTFFRDRDQYLQKPYVPTSFHYSEIRKNDIKMEAKVSFIKKNFSPNNTAIVTSSSYWRPVMYYFPKFPVYSPSGLDTKEEQYKFIFREGFNWNKKEYNNILSMFEVPKGIKNVVVFDDEAQSWVQNSSKKVYILDGNSSITVMSVLERVRMVYGFNVIKI